jgi:APA family basic amino acid/polyamine antiporter
VSKSHTLYWIVALGGLAGNTTVMLTSLLGQVRIFYVMARDRMLPPGVARIHHVFRTPARMTLVTGVIVAVFAAILPLTALLQLVNIGTLVAFAIVCGGVLVLRVANPSAPRPFRAPLLPLFSIGGAASCAYLITGLQTATWTRYVVWFFVGMIVYAIYGFRNSRLRVVP